MDSKINYRSENVTSNYTPAVLGELFRNVLNNKFYVTAQLINETK